MNTAYRLLEVLTVPSSEKVSCQWQGCNHPVFARIHVVLDYRTQEVFVVGSSCYRKMLGFREPESLVSSVSGESSGESVTEGSSDRAKSLVDDMAAYWLRRPEIVKAFSPEVQNLRAFAFAVKNYPVSLYGYSGFQEAEFRVRRQFDGFDVDAPGLVGLFRARVVETVFRQESLHGY